MIIDYFDEISQKYVFNKKNVLYFTMNGLLNIKIKARQDYDTNKFFIKIPLFFTVLTEQKTFLITLYNSKTQIAFFNQEKNISN